MRHPRPLSLFIFVFSRGDRKYVYNKILPMVGFELRASKIRSDRSANCATTTAQLLADFLCPKISFHSLTHFVLLIWHFFGRAKIVSISSKTKICKNAKKVSGFRKTKNFDFGNSKSNFLSGEVSLSLYLSLSLSLFGSFT